MTDSEHRVLMSKLKFNNAVVDFYDSAIKLLRVWEEMEDEEVYLDDLSGKYPFPDDLAEAVNRIGQWSEAVSDELFPKSSTTNVN